MRRDAVLATIYGGLIAGTIDIFAPALIYWINPLGVVQFIAGGLIGRPAAKAGGLEIAVLGVLLQWLMSLIIAAIFVFAATRIPALVRRWIAAGVAYGTVVFFVMNYVVRPLSMHRDLPKMNLYGFTTNMAAMWLFGLIVAWFAQRYLGTRRFG
jgi:uncharacterized membrane protein YagU involved in acid resistance